MANILIFGAGKSSSFLIRYLLDHAQAENWDITVADASEEAAQARVKDHPRGKAVQADIADANHRMYLVEDADLVISLLPPDLHFLLAADCLASGKHLLTASYVSDKIKMLDASAKNGGLLFMNELGLDPGIDHMSAMSMISTLKAEGATIHSFKSYCGGLVAPACDTNPWHYKFSWNPRNVVLAGKAGAHYLENGEEKHLDYKQLFSAVEHVDIPGLGTLAAYANRDSVSYQSVYGLDGVNTLLRATFRYPAFCAAWDKVVQLGLTREDDATDTEGLTYHDWFMAASKGIKGTTPEERMKTVCGDDAASFKLLRWMDMCDDDLIVHPAYGSSADILQTILETRWAMEENDRDMIVMHHVFNYEQNGVAGEWTSTLIVEGDDKEYTAMAKTVGLPLAIFARLWLRGDIQGLSGVQIPIMASVYEPVLKELEEYGIVFKETRVTR
jgi:saccharopine dehydrogenase (NADP+, L-glutamate forming)